MKRGGKVPIFQLGWDCKKPQYYDVPNYRHILQLRCEVIQGSQLFSHFILFDLKQQKVLFTGFRLLSSVQLGSKL